VGRFRIYPLQIEVSGPGAKPSPFAKATEDRDRLCSVFPKLGLVQPYQENTCLAWFNLSSDGSPDDRLIHAGVDPTKSIKQTLSVFCE